MGIVNVTPDSFSDGGRFLDPGRAAAHARQLIADGADIVDIGAESTRPGSRPVPEALELERLLPVLRELGKRHVQYGVNEQDYAAVGETLLWTLERGLGAEWNAESAFDFHSLSEYSSSADAKDSTKSATGSWNPQIGKSFSISDSLVRWCV